jgi:hypothetical protein
MKLSKLARVRQNTWLGLDLSLQHKGRLHSTGLPASRDSSLDSYTIPERGGVHKPCQNVVCHKLPPTPTTLWSMVMFDGFRHTRAPRLCMRNLL